MKFSLRAILGTIAIIIALFSAVWAANEYVAKAKDLRMVELRLDQKIDADRIKDIQQRIWMLEDRFGVDRSSQPKEVREEIRNLKIELQKLRLKWRR